MWIQIISFENMADLSFNILKVEVRRSRVVAGKDQTLYFIVNNMSNTMNISPYKYNDPPVQADSGVICHGKLPSI